MELNIRRILVPTDFGALSEHAVQVTRPVLRPLSAQQSVSSASSIALCPQRQDGRDPR